MNRFRELRVPGDKSITHRALLLAAAAHGESRLRGLLPGADCGSTARVLRQLGCEIPLLPADGSEIRIRGRGLEGWKAPGAPLDCGNSGTTTRLLMGLLAGRSFCATLTGDASLRGRPMRRVSEPLEGMGARVREIGAPDRLPLEICGGPLRSSRHRSQVASAQVKSAVLLAGISSAVPVTVWEPTQSRDHTERMLRGMEVAIREASANGVWEITLDPPGGPLPPLDLAVPGDFSSAAFLLAYGLLAPEAELCIPDVGLNPTRTGLLRVLERMGGKISATDISLRGGEPAGDLHVRSSALHATDVTGDEVPSMIDEIPILAVLAARAEGETRITGAAELRAKESDRIRALVQNLRVVGVEAEELPDGLAVRGTDRPLTGRVEACGDHRIAMAFGVLAALPGNRIYVDEPEVVNVSFPDFWTILQRLATDE